MPEDRRFSISSTPRLSPDEVAGHTFATARRGFDPEEVRAYLAEIARDLRLTEEREADLRRELAEAEHRAANPVLDEATLTAALGAETARVLHSAHEAAADMVSKAEAEATRLVAEAREEIEGAEARAESLLAERASQAEAAATDLRRRAQEDATAAREAARAEVEGLLSQGRTEAREMIEEAQSLRARVLADLSKRRKVLHAQIEQLRAGREHLAETVRDVRRSIDTIADDLFRAEDEARLAAEAAGREALTHAEEGTPEEQAASLLAAEAAAGAAVAAASEADAAEAGTVEVTEAAAMAQGARAEGEAEAASTAPGLPVETGVSTEELEAVGETGAEGPAGAGGAEVGPTATGPSESPIDAGAGAGTISSEPAQEEEASRRTAEEAFAKLRAAQGAESAPQDVEPDGARATDGDATDQDATDGEPPEGAGGDAEEHEGSDEGSDEESTDGAPPVVRRRDELTTPVVAALARRLKRILQDEQNELLDRLRSADFAWSLEVLPEEVAHRDELVIAALPFLEEAAAAGRTFAGHPDATGPAADTLAAVAGELADTVVGPLRRRLTDDERARDAEEPVVAEHVGAAFREWKGRRVEQLAGDYVLAAFAEGTLAVLSSEPRSQVEWIPVAAPGARPCPDCEDNGLNGAQAPGAEFPTGHRRPPAHPGCRCLVAAPVT